MVPRRRCTHARRGARRPAPAGYADACDAPPARAGRCSCTTPRARRRAAHHRSRPCSDQGDRVTEELSPISDRARELVRGAIDTHVHISPDVVGRKIDDLSLARRCLELGLGGFLLKSHYTSTAERAAVVRAAVPGVEVLGAITLT